MHHGAILREAVALTETGKLKPLLSKRQFSFKDVDAALAFVETWALYRLSTPENVWKLVIHFGSMAEKIYYGFFEIKPHLLPVAVKSSILMVIAAICPYGSVYLLDLWHRYQIKRNAKNHFRITKGEKNG